MNTCIKSTKQLLRMFPSEQWVLVAGIYRVATRDHLYTISSTSVNIQVYDNVSGEFVWFIADREARDLYEVFFKRNR